MNRQCFRDFFLGCFYRWRIFLFLVFIAPTGVFAADKDIDQISSQLIQRSNNLIHKLSAQAEQGEITKEFALQLIQENMSPLLDFNYLTKRAMGRYRRGVDESTFDQISASFRLLLEVTYAKVLSRYSGQQVSLLEAKILPSGEPSVVLQVSDGDKSVDIEYVYLKDDNTRIGDIKVEGISLVTNYRRQFAEIIKQSGIDGLVKKLQALSDRSS